MQARHRRVGIAQRLQERARMIDPVDESHVREHPGRCGRHQSEAEEPDEVGEQDRVAEAAEAFVPAEVDPEQRQADHGELRVPVCPRRSGYEQRGGVGHALHGQLKEVMRHPLLERDHTQPVPESLARGCVREVPDREVREVEPEPDDELDPEVPPTARQHTTSQRRDSLHGATLILRVTGRPR